MYVWDSGWIWYSNPWMYPYRVRAHFIHSIYCCKVSCCILKTKAKSSYDTWIWKENQKMTFSSPPQAFTAPYISVTTFLPRVLPTGGVACAACLMAHVISSMRAPSSSYIKPDNTGVETGALLSGWWHMLKTGTYIPNETQELLKLYEDISTLYPVSKQVSCTSVTSCKQPTYHKMRCLK